MHLLFKILIHKNSKNWGLAILFLIFICGCRPTKKLLPNEYLVDKVIVSNTEETHLPTENFEAFIRQKPNRKLFRFAHFYVWWYNLYDENKITEIKQKRNLRYDTINAKRIRKTDLKNIERAKKGKKPKIPKLKDKDEPILRESIRDIGEPAVVLDSASTEQTRSQLSKYLFSKGFFNNLVTDTIVLKKNNKHAIIEYKVHANYPYKISNITYKMDDEKLGAIILKDTIHTLLKRGMIYDIEKFQSERQRITDYVLNNGYYYFENAYIGFNIDSNATKHTVNVELHLKKFTRTYSSTNDSLIFVNHTRYKLQNVFVITEPLVGNLREIPFKDTLHVKNKSIVYLLNNPLAYRKVLIANYIDLYKGQFFRKDTAEQTYKQLLGLGIFKNVSIKFLKSLDYSNQLDCYIVCSPLVKQSITTESGVTNTTGNPGFDLSVVYQNKNFFKGGELIELKLQGSLIGQKQFNSEDQSNTNITELQKIFNTVQFGPELTFSVPRAFFPFSLLPFTKEMSPRTYIKSSFNFQSRPEYSRVITNINYGFNFKSNQGRLRHDVIPFEAYLIRATLTNSFRNYLASSNDAFLANSFQDHITTLSRYGLTFTSKENSNTSRKPVSFIKWNIMSSGNILRKYFESSGEAADSLNRYLLFKIPFAQFLRTDVDYRIYIPIRKKSRVVYRLAGGIGKPLTNLSVIPYEQSFFSGGPNSVRAWRARTLGPGGYDPSNSEARFDKIGDILLEGNIEYRFHIIKSFNGALFVDAGNIWRLNKDVSKPNGEFLVDEFYKQIALGGGMGLRMDLGFFVIRLDLATPLYDPKYAEGDRWTYDKKPWTNIVANFGIGYPF
ncbi:MAG: BamA/TamA family outer membrane protein [Bacteroidota bacterium]|nr:BamA/TamA family outer membrane protein [Bacteroidota bacterium]